jgi:hypothetical protein
MDRIPVNSSSRGIGQPTNSVDMMFSWVFLRVLLVSTVNRMVIGVCQDLG